MGYSILAITNGTTRIDLLKPAGSSGFHLKEWLPAIAGMKAGGIWRESIMGDGRSLVMRQWANVFENFILDISGGSQIQIIGELHSSRQLLEDARDYWLPRSSVSPVWVEARTDCEDYSRYAYIYDWATPNDNNPFAPGFGGATPMFTDFQLTIERGHWMDTAPGAGTCIQISSQRSGYIYGANLILNPGFETAGAGGADVFANWTETAGGGTITQDATTFYSGTKSAKLTGTSYIQQNITVVAGSTYAISIKSCSTNANFPPTYEILNITAGGSVVASTALRGSSIANGLQITSFAVTIPGGCTSIGIKLNASAFGNTFFDAISVKLMTAITRGVAATCLENVFIPNASRLANITDIYRYDASAATFSANLVNASRPFNLFPDPIDQNDALYIGMDDDALYPGSFDCVIFNIGSANPMNGDWEYWTGAAWSELITLWDTGQAFSNNGIQIVTFDPPANMAKTAVNGVYGYWIRWFNPFVGTITPVPQQITDPIYTPALPYAEVAAAQIPGDISALINTSARGYNSEGQSYPNGSIIQAIRKTERGVNFDPFINCCDNQNPAGVVVSSNYLTSIVNRPRAATGRAMKFTTASADTGQFSVTISRPLLDSYKGTFRLLLRAEDANPTLLSARVIVSAAGSLDRSSKFSQAYADLDGVFDFGKITLPLAELGVNEVLSSVTFQFILSTSNAGGTTAYIYDLILIPIDESIVEAWSPTGYGGAFYDQVITIDSIFPKKSVRSISKLISDNSIVEISGVVAATQAQLVPNKDQRIIFIDPGNYGWEARVDAIFRPTINRVSRYFSLRGDR